MYSISLTVAVITINIQLLSSSSPSLPLFVYNLQRPLPQRTPDPSVPNCTAKQPTQGNGAQNWLLVSSSVLSKGSQRIQFKRKLVIMCSASHI